MREPSSQLLGEIGQSGIASNTDEVWIDVIQKMDDVYSELVESQAELETKNKRLEDAYAFIDSVLASMADIVIVCNAQGIILQVNRALETLSGHRADELVGRKITSIFCEESAAVVGGFMGLLKAGKPITQCDVSLASVSAELAALSVNCSARTDHSGRIDGMVIVGRPVGELLKAYRELDVTHKQLSKTQQQLLVSEKMAALGRLVAGVAHGLNNPISFVFGNMYALKRYGSSLTDYLKACDQGLDEHQMRALRDELKIDQLLADIGPLVDGTLEGAERVRDIVQDLRRFSSNQQEAPETFNAIRLVRTAVDWVIQAQRVKPEITFNLPDQLEMTGRKGQLHQIVVNLVQNAADVLDGQPDGLIEISCEATNGDVCFTVSDNGTGIEPKHLDKIFEPFFTTKPIGTGTGLGLYVSYSMALKQGGDLSVTNRPEGGAQFVLRVPREAPEDTSEKSNGQS